MLLEHAWVHILMDCLCSSFKFQEQIRDTEEYRGIGNRADNSRLVIFIFCGVWDMLYGVRVNMLTSLALS